MMEELPLYREDEGILEDSDATAQGAAVEVQAEATQPLSQPSAKKGAFARSNCNGETHCFHCGEEVHWANVCTLLLEEQQSQLQMNIIVEDEAADEENEYKKEKGSFMEIQMAMLQGQELPRNTAYLDNCFTVTALKTAKYIRNIKTKKGDAGELKFWEHKGKPKRGVRTS